MRSASCRFQATVSTLEIGPGSRAISVPSMSAKNVEGKNGFSSETGIRGSSRKGICSGRFLADAKSVSGGAGGLCCAAASAIVLAQSAASNSRQTVTT